MAKKKTQIPKYGTITLKGIQYYRTRITDADGKELSLYAATCEELYEKQLEARTIHRNTAQGVLLPAGIPVRVPL